jgi:hypothetical protein
VRASNGAHAAHQRHGVSVSIIHGRPPEREYLPALAPRGLRRDPLRIVGQPTANELRVEFVKPHGMPGPTFEDAYRHSVLPQRLIG